jgi:autotransporter translocation and assembly factor TamB
MMLKLLKRLIITTISFVGILALIISLTIFALNSEYIQKLGRNLLNAAIPGSITWDRLDISLLDQTIDLRGAALAGSDTKPIVQCERLTAGISWKSALRGRLDIQDAELEKPIVLLGIDGNGRLNILNALGIPLKKKDTLNKPRQTLPDFLIVETCRLKKGRFGFTRRSSGLEIEVNNIDCIAGLDFGRETGSLKLQAGGGFFTLKKSRTDIKNLHLASSIAKGIAERLVLEARTTGSNIRLQGQIRELFSNPSFDIASSVYLSLSELHDILNLARPMSGVVTGEFSARGNVNNPSLSFTGRYGGGALYGSIVGSIVADIALVDRLLSISGLRAVSGPGYCELQGEINMRNAFADGFIMPGRNPDNITYHATVRSRQFDLQSIPGIKTSVQGFMDSDISISGKGLSPGSASAALSLAVSIPNFSYGTESTPAGLSVNAGADINAGILNIKKCSAVFGSARFQAEGYCDTRTNSIQGSFTVLSPNISHELASLDLKGFIGSMAVDGSVSGTIQRPVAFIGMSGDHLYYREMAIGSIKMNASLDGTGMLSINRFSLVNNASSIQLSAGARLFESGITAIAEDPRIDMTIEKFELYPGDFDNAYTGRIALTGRLSGSRKKPRGTITLEASDVDVGYQKIHSMNLESNLDGEKIRIDTLTISISPGEAIRCKGWIGMDRSYDLSILSDPISFKNIRMIDTSGGLTGRLAVDLAGRGALNNPSFNGTAVMTDLAFRDTRYDDVSITLQVKEYRAAIKGRLNFDVDGYYNIRNRNFMLSLLFNETDLAPYFSSLGRKSLQGKLSGTVKASGNIAFLDRAELAVAISRLDIFKNETRLIHSDAFNASLAKENISIPGISMSVLDTGRIRINGSGNLVSGVNINLDAKIPLELANRLSEDMTNFSGDVALNAVLTGTRSQPQLNAVMLFNNVGLTIPAIAGDIHGLRGTIDISPGLVKLDDIRGFIGNGKFDMKGVIGLRGLRPVSARLNANASGIPINIPNILNTTIDAGVTISGTNTASTIRGNFILLNGLYYQDLVLNPLINTGSKSGTGPGPGRKNINALLDNMNLDIAITNKAPFEIENNLASLKINTALKIIGTVSKPILIGNAQAAEGKIFYLGRDFIINKGKIDFTNPYRIEPYIDISSSAVIQKWNVSIGITGTPESLKYQLSSSPVLDTNNILSLVLLGKTTGEGSTYSAGQILTSLIAFNYGGTIKKKTGIDILEVTDIASKDNTSSKGERVTVGKNIDERLTYKYSIEKDGKNFKSSSIVEYRLFDSFLMDLIYDTMGKVGTELQYNKEFR